MTDDDLVFSGAGVVTAAGVGLADHLRFLDGEAAPPAARDFSLSQLKAAPLLSDRRMLKTISPIDAIGLVGIEDLRRQGGCDAATLDPERVGLFVGSPPAHAIDGAFHLDAMDAARDAAGRCSIREFGRTSAGTRPTALLSGLPNNVLCYGSMLLDARGPNSNYNCLETSGQTAVIAAGRAFRRGRLDLAVAGGFSAHTLEPNASMFARLGVRTTLADGAVFFTIEARRDAVARGAPIFAAYVAGAVTADALGPLIVAPDGGAMGDAIATALAAGGVTRDELGLVLLSGTGIAAIDDGELTTVTMMFAGARRPAIGTTAGLFGNLMEAGGLLEIALCGALYARGRLPGPMLIGPEDRIDAARRHALILRSSVWGERSCLLVRID